MSEINQFLKDLDKHSDFVKKCTSPLIHLGVTCFYYLSINPDGNHVLLTDCPEVDDYYYDEKLYLKDPYLRHPENYQSGFFSLETNHKEEYDESLAFVVRNFKIAPLVGLCERQQDSVEFFGFWGATENCQNFEHVYLNYTNLLKTFAVHFKKECQELIRYQEGPSLSLPKLLGTDLFNSGPTLQPKLQAASFRRYLQEIGMGHQVAKADSLSNREKECVRLLLKGMAMKEMGTELKISPRTVEHYLENIKIKFDCRYKNELFVLSEQLVQIGLI